MALTWTELRDKVVKDVEKSANRELVLKAYDEAEEKYKGLDELNSPDSLLDDIKSKKFLVHPTVAASISRAMEASKSQDYEKILFELNAVKARLDLEMKEKSRKLPLTKGDGSQTGLGNFAPFTFPGPASKPPNLAPPITRYLIVDTGAIDRGTDVLLPPEDAALLGLGEAEVRPTRVQVAGGHVATIVDYSQLVRVKLTFLDGQERVALLRASSFVVPPGGRKIPMVRQYIMCYSGLNLLKVKVDPGEHCISLLTEEEEEEDQLAEEVGIV